eukprot:scaffold51168_cov35-Tisochrysis_lutea.AAC.5
MLTPAPIVCATQHVRSAHSSCLGELALLSVVVGLCDLRLGYWIEDLGLLACEGAGCERACSLWAIGAGREAGRPSFLLIDAFAKRTVKREP